MPDMMQDYNDYKRFAELLAGYEKEVLLLAIAQATAPDDRLAVLQNLYLIERLMSYDPALATELLDPNECLTDD